MQSSHVFSCTDVDAAPSVQEKVKKKVTASHVKNPVTLEPQHFQEFLIGKKDVYNMIPKFWLRGALFLINKVNRFLRIICILIIEQCSCF